MREQIETALSTVSPEDEVEIAFFGGSFTGIDRGLMLRLLDTAQAFVDEGRVSSIRLSTRPDYISEEILNILSRYAVKHIELGLQSMSDEVLAATKRGHTAEDARAACRAVTEAGFSLTGQMMIGLPASTRESEVTTARELVRMGVHSVRIYPTVVFYDTPLYHMTISGQYVPLTIEEAVSRSADVLEIFEAEGIPCIRLGLCATEELTSPETAFAGPNHPALGEMVMSESCYRRIRAVLQEQKMCGRDVILHVPAREISRAVGHGRRNVEKLLKETGTRVLRVLGDAPEGTVTVSPWNTPNTTHHRRNSLCI